MKCLYIALYNSNGDNDVDWFIGNDKKDPIEQFIRHFKKDYDYKMDYDEIIDVWKVCHDDILEIAKEKYE